MRICSRHWEMLRAEIDASGMSHLVARNSEEAFENVVNDIEGKTSAKDTFDPLMNANFSIMGAALTQGGLYLMSGDLCPICEAMKNTAEWPEVEGGPPVGEAWVERHWIEGPVKEQLKVARELGLMPSIQ